jgi:hypothetical protein
MFPSLVLALLTVSNLVRINVGLHLMGSKSFHSADTMHATREKEAGLLASDFNCGFLYNFWLSWLSTLMYEQ